MNGFTDDFWMNKQGIYQAATWNFRMESYIVPKITEQNKPTKKAEI